MKILAQTLDRFFSGGTVGSIRESGLEHHAPVGFSGFDGGEGGRQVLGAAPDRHGAGGRVLSEGRRRGNTRITIKQGDGFIKFFGGQNNVCGRT